MPALESESGIALSALSYLEVCDVFTCLMYICLPLRTRPVEGRESVFPLLCVGHQEQSPGNVC